MRKKVGPERAEKGAKPSSGDDASDAAPTLSLMDTLLATF